MSAPPRFQRARRIALRVAGIGAGALVLLWIAIHVFPGLGPALADGARTLFGPELVAKVEDVAYGVQDDVNSVRFKDAPPTTFWDEAPDAAIAEPDAGDEPSYFPPPRAEPPYPRVAAENDGVWLWMPDDAIPTGSAVLAKTQLHPDPKRPHAAVAVVAMDLGRLELVMMPGTQEPESKTLKERPGKIPERDWPSLVAAFNGGWQTIHGHYGMKVDGIELLPPRDHCCTIGLFAEDRSVRIGTWRKMIEERTRFVAYRQTPQCLWENAIMNPELTDGTRNWGAAVGGDTIIRRSGLGLDRERRVLFYGVGDNLTAKTLGEALFATGAVDIAELDVNWTFPRYLTYTHTTNPPSILESLVPSPHKAGEYVARSWYRDFFYVKRKEAALDGGAPERDQEGGAP